MLSACNGSIRSFSPFLWYLCATKANRLDRALCAAHTDSMKSAAFNKLIANVLTMPEVSVLNFSRRLKEAGLVSTGARGINAPEMTPMDAARVTLAILTTDSPLHCVERVRRFGQINYSPDFKKAFRGYETIKPDHFASLFQGETLEQVLAYMFGLPALVGIEESCKWFEKHVFHLRVFDFEVLAELFQWKSDGNEITGELVVPFKGDPWATGLEVIKGGVRTERSISGLSFLSIGLGLIAVDQNKEGVM